MKQEIQELVLIRGEPGAGKTTLAKRMKKHILIEADQYFTRRGKYKEMLSSFLKPILGVKLKLLVILFKENLSLSVMSFTDIGCSFLIFRWQKILEFQ